MYNDFLRGGGNHGIAKRVSGMVGEGVLPVKSKKGGFTLIELVLVMIILAIVAASFLARFVDLSGLAKDAVEKYVIAAVKQGIINTYLESIVK
ncbi:type II secretion system protein [Candidatus Saganbacteria bacterium]|uniref:Type II secretion system protein n=1 Tax=Candidatus Saganbacteria bacterium TaxID=2575572 RepID=A0A9D6YW36_UNCSA|nr:type II secretion system protein [Candidatus Saganbacteria bacterium]